MDIKSIVIAVAVVCAISLVVGIVLGIAEKVFRVDVNEKEEKVRELLPGSNCGGCGYAGCDALAHAIAEGEAPASACPVGGKPVAEKVAAVMGADALWRGAAGLRAAGAADGACQQAEKELRR